MISPFLVVGLYIAIGIITLTVVFYFLSKRVDDGEYFDSMMTSVVAGMFWPMAIVACFFYGLVQLIHKYFLFILKYSKNR